MRPRQPGGEHLLLAGCSVWEVTLLYGDSDSDSDGEGDGDGDIRDTPITLI